MDWTIKDRRESRWAVQCPRISDLYQAAVEGSKTARSPEARALLRQVFPADFQRLEQLCLDRLYGRAPPPRNYRSSVAGDTPIRPTLGFKTMKSTYATIKSFEVMRALKNGH